MSNRKESASEAKQDKIHSVIFDSSVSALMNFFCTAVSAVASYVTSKLTHN